MKSAELILKLVHERGPLTVAAFMDLALYDPESGYYSGAVRRSGRAGDFFTSVDVGALFGELLEVQIAEMADILANLSAEDPGAASRPSSAGRFDLVEAGAGDGRLSADILTAARLRHPDLYQRTELHLVEVSPEAPLEER